ncbi:MAG: hypothetical protein QF530_08480 [SAR202 cluster bacterium]|jgi:hypothetical protein|nr:hypothetical protein [SAR202 cluster bacterium]
MSKYLLQASYLVDGVNGLLKEGGTSRKATVEKLTESMGGSLEVLWIRRQRRLRHRRHA